MKTLALIIVATVVLALTGTAMADESAKATTVGGGVANPWRSPYKTAALPTTPASTVD